LNTNTNLSTTNNNIDDRNQSQTNDNKMPSIYSRFRESI